MVKNSKNSKNSDEKSSASSTQKDDTSHREDKEIENESSDDDNKSGLSKKSFSTIKLNQRAIQKIAPLKDLKNKAELKTHIGLLRQAKTTCSNPNEELPIANLMDLMSKKDQKLFKIKALTKIDISSCTVDQYIDFLESYIEPTENNDSEISAKINSISIDDITSSINKGKSSRDKFLDQICEIDDILIKNSTVCGELDEIKYASLQELCLAQLYTNLENQCQIRQNEQSSSIWACICRVPEVSANVEENSANQDKCLVEWRKMETSPIPKTLMDAAHRISVAFEIKIHAYNQYKAFFGSPANISSKSNPIPDTKHGTDKKRKRNEKDDNSDKPSKVTKSCYGCGKSGHLKNECLFQNLHPDFNTESKPFTESTKGSAYIVAYEQSKGRKTTSLDKKFVVSHGKLIEATTETMAKKKGKYSHIDILSNDIMNLEDTTPQYIPNISDNNNFIKGVIKVHDREIAVDAILLDPGAIGNSRCYISKQLEKFLVDSGVKEIAENCKVCVPNGYCSHIAKAYIFDLFVNNEFKINIKLIVKAAPYDLQHLTFRYDMILSRQFIKDNSLVVHFPSHFLNAADIKELVPTLEGIVGRVRPPQGRFRTHAYPNDDGSATHQVAIPIPKEALLDISPKDDGGLSASWDGEVPPWEIDDSQKEDHECIPKGIFGSPDEIERVKRMCLKHIKVFKRTLNQEPARLEPFEILINKEKYEEKLKNIRSQKPRMQSRVKQMEIKKQNTTMLDMNVIQPTDALYLSQVHLTTKPDSSWRYCIDFREINDISDAMPWPLPNIRHTVDQIGMKGWTHFGCVDLTKGFWQATLSASSKKYTAFTTWMGNFEWNRVPFGLKGAPSYYQRQIQQNVLRGLMHNICFAYIDDIIFGGHGFEECLKNFDLILTRLESFGITLNPDKCTINVREVKGVGYILDSTGLRFSDDKLESVRIFPLPVAVPKLHSFLGLVNYFRDHIDSSYVDFSHRLYELLHKEKDKKRPIQWTDDLQNDFESLKELVANTPKLYYIDDIAECHLCTDASEYGIGAYLYQLIGGREVPIQFLSKKLTDTQRRWSVPEKEAFAIFYSLKKLAYLLRDRHFMLHTDHINLTYINDHAMTSDKVYNWKLEVQEYDFHLVFIAGTDNIVADSMSRLCVLEDTETDEVVEYINAIYEMFVPQHIQSDFEKVHNSVVGHKGVSKTYKRALKAGMKHENLKHYIKILCKQCRRCQENRQERLITKTMPYTTARYSLWECIAVDTVGPLPEDKYGYKYVLNIIDMFSRFEHLIATKNVDAQSALRALLQHVGLFGVPNDVQSDRGTQFINEAVADLVDELGCRQIKTTAYSKEENAIVERSNKEINRYLRDLTQDKDVVDRWSDFLPLVQRTINSTEHESIGAAPAQLVFPNVDLNRMFPFEDQSNDRTEKRLSEYVAKAKEIQDRLVETAKQVQVERDAEHMKRAFSTLNNRQVSPYKEGDYVLIEFAEGRPTKLSKLRKGPFKILRIENRNVIVQDLLTNSEQPPVDIDRVVPFYYNSTVTNPEVIAAQEKSMFIVEKILKHRKVRNTYDILVKWLGYDSPEDITWEPISNYKHNTIFHEYCRNNNLVNLIPKEYK